MAYVDPNAVRYSSIGPIFPTKDTPLRRSMAVGANKIGTAIAAALQRRERLDREAKAEKIREQRAAKTGADQASKLAARKEKLMKAQIDRFKGLLADEEWAETNPEAAELVNGLLRAANLGLAPDDWLAKAAKWHQGYRASQTATPGTETLTPGAEKKKKKIDQAAPGTETPTPGAGKRKEAAPTSLSTDETTFLGNVFSGIEGDAKKVKAASDSDLGTLLGGTLAGLQRFVTPKWIADAVPTKTEPLPNTYVEPDTGARRAFTPKERAANADLLRFIQEAKQQPPELDVSTLRKRGEPEQRSMLSWLFGDE